MPVIVQSGGDFEPAPEGLHRAVCVDVVDLGPQTTPWGERHKVKLIWELSCQMDNGRPFTISKRYTASLHAKSNLNKDLTRWRGRPFTSEELAGFDLEQVIGAPCQVLVQHAEKDGSVYGNVTAVMRVGTKPEEWLKPSGGYVRQKDRAPATRQDDAGSEEMPDDADQIPF
jgi:hypothetical protein